MLRFADGRVDENKQGFCENDDVTSGDIGEPSPIKFWVNKTEKEDKPPGHE